MAIKHSRPTTPSQRFLSRNRAEVSTKRPEKSLTEPNRKSGGRNCYGRITTRRRGGGHKRLYRIIDFRRNLLDVPGRVEAIEYDPNRSANIALLVFPDESKSYILAPQGLAVGDSVVNATSLVALKPGNTMPLRVMPPATFIHALELVPGRGAKLVRAAGNAAQLVGVDGDRATVKLPSGEIRVVHADCRATIGVVGNSEHQNRTFGKAGRKRWLGKRPRVRGMVMNPVDHPNGGGNGKSKGGGGRQQLMSPWGQLAKGFPTRRKSKESNRSILVRRNGRKVK